MSGLQFVFLNIDPYALTTLAAVKAHLNIPPTQTEQDVLLVRFINAASAKIEQYLDRKILKRAYIEHQDGRNNDRTLLAQWPADKPTQVWIDPSSQFTNPQNQLSVDEYELEADFGLKLLVRYFPKGRRNVRIVYEAGYDRVPYDIAESCIWLVEFLYDMRSNKRIGMASKSKNNENTTFATDLPPVIQQMLEPYRRVDFASGTVAVQNI